MAKYFQNSGADNSNNKLNPDISMKLFITKEKPFLVSQSYQFFYVQFVSSFNSKVPCNIHKATYQEMTTEV